MYPPFPSRPDPTGDRAAPSARPGVLPASATEIAELRESLRQLIRKFAFANGPTYLASVLLTCVLGGLLSTQIVGAITLSMLLLLLQGGLLLVTAWRFDQGSAQVFDRRVESLPGRPTVEHGGGDPAHSVRAAANAWSADGEPSQFRHTYRAFRPSRREAAQLGDPLDTRHSAQHGSDHSWGRSVDNGTGEQ